MTHTPFFVTPYPTKADIEAPKDEETLWREMPLSELEYLLKAERQRGTMYPQHWAYCPNRHSRMWKVYLERRGS